MNGYGGNSVLLLPNGVTFYIFSDGYEFPWAQPLSLAGDACPNVQLSLERRFSRAGANLRCQVTNLAALG